MRTWPSFAQQVEVLHVARADLEAVDIRKHDLDLRDLHDLGDDEQAVFVGRFAHDLQAFDAHALEAVRRAARLERAAAKELRAGGGNLLRAEANLVAAFNRARAGHDDDLFAADGDAVGEADVRTLRAEAATGEFVRRGDAISLVNTGEHLEFSDLEVPGCAHTRQNGLRLACSPVDVEAQLDHALDHVLDLLISSSILHCDDHHWSPSCAVRMTAFSCECVRESRDGGCSRLAFAAGGLLRRGGGNAVVGTLQRTHDVHDALVDVLDLFAGERSGVGLACVLDDLLLAARLVDSGRGLAFDLADGDGAGCSFIEQLNDLLIQFIDSGAPVGDVHRLSSY